MKKNFVRIVALLYMCSLRFDDICELVMVV